MIYSKYALPKFRYQELKNYCLQYRWYDYVVNAINNGTYDIEKHAKEFGFKEKDPTALAAMLNHRCASRLEVIADSLEKAVNIFIAEGTHKIEDEKILLEFLKRSVTNEISYFVLKKDGLELTQEDFAYLRMIFFFELSKEVS